MSPTQTQLWEDDRDEALLGNLVPPSQPSESSPSTQHQDPDDPCFSSSSSPSPCDSSP